MYNFLKILAVISIVFFACAALNASASRSANTKAEAFFGKPLDLALVQAALNNDSSKVREQIIAGANINAIGVDGITPLLFVMFKANIKAFRLLLENGANPNYQVINNPERRNKGISVMSLAAAAISPAYLKEALTHHGDTNLINPYNGETPIFDAISAERIDNLKILIEYGANLNYQNEKRGRATPLIAAAAATRYDFVYVLINAGADAWVKNATGRTMVDILKEDLSSTTLSDSQRSWGDKTLSILSQKPQEK